jgi:transposase
MVTCKRCGGTEFVKNGIVAGKQRYRCKHCRYNFREGDQRTNDKVAAKKALCVLFYSMAKGSFRMLGRLLETDHTLVYRWIRQFGETLPEPTISGKITEMEFDEMWHFIGQKKETLDPQSR